jgi:drug/metabolite transporter (DMT)-like permease
VLVALAVVYVVWSSTYLAVRYAVGADGAVGLPPMSMGGTRYLAAGVVLMTVARATGARMPDAGEWLRTIPIALLFLVMGNGFLATAERSIDSGVAALVCGTMPLWGALIGRFTGEVIRPREWAGLALGLLGMVTLGWGSSLRAAPLAWALLAVAPFGWALGSILIKRLRLPREGMVAAASQMILGGTMMLGLGAALGERLPQHVPPSAWLAVVYLTVMGSLVGFSAYIYLLRHARTPLAMSYAYVNPPLAVLLAAAMGDAKLKGTTIASTALVVVGVVVMVSKPKESS